MIGVAIALTFGIAQVAEATEIAPTASPEVSDAGPTLVTEPLGDGIERVLADDAGHRFDRGRVREVEVADDGTVWVASGQQVIALGQPGSLMPRKDGWRSFPRRLALAPDGRLWAVEDGGDVIARGDQGWSPVGLDEIGASDPWAMLEGPDVAPIAEAGIDERVPLRAIARGPQGDIWVLAGPDPRARPGDHLLLHHTADGWQVLGPSDGMPLERARAWTASPTAPPAAMVVDDAGRLWFSADRLGLWVLDGATFCHIDLPGLRLGALDMHAGPDGSVWIASTTGRLYRATATD